MDKVLNSDEKALGSFSFEALRSGNFEFLNPFTGSKVSSLRSVCYPEGKVEIGRSGYGVSCDIFAVEPGEEQVFFSGILPPKGRKGKLIDYSRKTKEPFPFLIAILSMDHEELWKIRGPGKVSRVYKKS